MARRWVAVAASRPAGGGAQRLGYFRGGQQVVVHLLIRYLLRFLRPAAYCRHLLAMMRDVLLLHHELLLEPLLEVRFPITSPVHAVSNCFLIPW